MERPWLKITKLNTSELQCATQSMCECGPTLLEGGVWG